MVMVEAVLFQEAEPDLPGYAAAHRGADLPRLQRGSDRGAAPRQRRPEQHLPTIREVAQAFPLSAG